MEKSDVSVLFLGKEYDEHCARALEFCRNSFRNVSAALGQWGDAPPPQFDSWSGDLVVSYLSRWVVPARMIQRAKLAAINFHPASPEYPGIGCNNFALYEEAAEYGATCHHMAATVDTGPIIAVRRFPILRDDTVASLLQRTYEHQLELFHDVMSIVRCGETLPVSQERWTRPPFTRKQFNELGRIDPAMDAPEIARRVRATSFGKWQPRIELAGYVFELKPAQ
jgi:methionyl-tRNA formyltransferase